MKVGIVINGWKLKVFERRLKESEFQWEERPGVTQGTLLLSVEVLNPAHFAKLENVIRDANDECRAQ